MKTLKFSIPAEVINAINFLDPADRGLAFSALFELLAGDEPSVELTPAARAAFEFAKIIIMPAIERRRRAEQRRAERLEAAKKADPTRREAIPAPEKQPADKWTAEYCNELAKSLEADTKIMKKVVDLAFRTCSTKNKVDRQVRQQLQSRFNGKYSDIFYDRNGNCQLIPA